jgi:hypothetical protein
MKVFLSDWICITTVASCVAFETGVVTGFIIGCLFFACYGDLRKGLDNDSCN